MNRVALLALAGLGLSASGCSSSGSSGGQSGLQTLGNIIAFQSTTPPPAQPLPREADVDFVCPQVIVAEGGAAIRAQSGPDSGSLRHQISITDVARECTPTGAGGFRLKLGVEGRVLAGPAGGFGTQSTGLQMRVTRGTAVVASRVARVGGTVSAAQGSVGFSHVEDGIVVPPGTGETEIIVGLGGGGERPARSRRR